MNFFINHPIGTNPKFSTMKKQLKPVVKRSDVAMYLTIPFENWERFGVSIREDSEYMHEEEDAFFIKNLDLQEIPTAVAEFNAKHNTAFSISDFHYTETRYLSFEHLKPKQAPKMPIEDYFGVGIIGVMLAITLALFLITIYETIF